MSEHLKNNDSIENELELLKKENANLMKKVSGLKKTIDITSRHGDQLQLELREARDLAEEANRAKSTFLSTMSHEIRTPLNAILGYAQLMKQDSSLSQKHKEMVHIINKSGAHLLSLINDILEMSKIEAKCISLQEKEVDLFQMLDTLKSIFIVRAKNKNLKITIDLSPNVPQFIHTDERKLRQILFNLLSNAIKFSKQGEIFLRMHTNSLENDEIILFSEIQDNGIGIGEDELTKLFKPFQQTKSGHLVQEGTGLGLSICKSFVELMGGEISVESAPDKGSIFKFTVNVKKSEKESQTSNKNLKQVTGLKANQKIPKILVVEDNEESRFFLVEILNQLGLNVSEAVDGKDAIEKWHSIQPDLIWMDIMMPKMDGKEATKRIKAADSSKKTKIIALTASAFEEDRKKIMDCGCDDFIGKPFKVETLYEAMNRHIGLEYEYMDENISTNIEIDSGSKKIDVQNLKELPENLFLKLFNAAMNLSIDQITSLIPELKKHDQNLANEIQLMIQNLDFDHLLYLVDQAKK